MIALKRGCSSGSGVSKTTADSKGSLEVEWSEEWIVGGGFELREHYGARMGKDRHLRETLCVACALLLNITAV